MLARTMTFEFRQPVYTDDHISCTWTTNSVEEREGRYDLTARVGCENQESNLVLSRTVEGIVWKNDSVLSVGR